MEKKILISLQHVTKSYTWGDAVKDVSFDLYEKGIYGLVGPNGAGKTTLMKMLGGIASPTDGDIVMYEDGAVVDHEYARKKMSFMIEEPFLKQNQNARQNLKRMCLLRGIKDEKCIEEVLTLVGLDQVPNQKVVKKYSLGMKQRLGIAGALLSKPNILVLDEPANGLDPGGIVELRQLLKKLNQETGITILISSHILSELAMLCNAYIFIQNGVVLENITAQELQRKEQNLEEHYLKLLEKNV